MNILVQQRSGNIAYPIIAGWKTRPLLKEIQEKIWV